MPRELAFAIALKPCGSCGGAIPALGSSVCQACYEGGYCPTCAVRHGPRMCPQVRKVWDQQEAIERASKRASVAEWAQRLREQWSREDQAFYAQFGSKEKALT